LKQANSFSAKFWAVKPLTELNLERLRIASAEKCADAGNLCKAAAILVQPCFDLISLHPRVTTPSDVHQDIIDRIHADPSIEWEKLIPLNALLNVNRMAAPLRAPDRYGHRLREYWQFLLTDDHKIALPFIQGLALPMIRGQILNDEFSTGL
jgi:hypothetical protein